MERMTPDTDKREGLGEGIYAKFVQNYEKLLEENKKLKEYIAWYEKEENRLREENKKLKEELSKYKEQYQHSLGGDDELIYEEGLYD